MKTKYFHIALAIWSFAVVPIGFSESFTNRPSAGEMGEIVEEGMVCGNAVRERGLAVNDAGTFFPYCGHGQSYFASLQQEQESLATLYIDHVNGPLSAGVDSFRYFTLATWRAVAGLNSSGFRRFADSAWYYGVMQSGDVIGVWILEDLQEGFSALMWSVRWNTWDNNVWYKGFPTERGTPSSGITPEEAKANAEAAYAADTPIAWVGSYIVPEAYSWVHRISSTNYQAGLVRAYNTATFDFSGIGLDADTIGLYIRGYAYLAGCSGSQIINGQGDGVTANLCLIEQKNYTPGVQFNVIHGWPQPMWPPSNPSSDGAYNTYGYYSQYDTSLHYKGFLIKWNFANP